MGLVHWYIEVMQKNEWKIKQYKYKQYQIYIMGLPIITRINGRKHFQELLESNPGVLIIKFGATWCGPCKVIEKDVIIFT
jgi:thiol-disulfide isomerase/thioredoxin